jgi:hypothetical protein
MAVKGLWNIGGINLPDFSINENLSKLFGVNIGPQNAATNPGYSGLQYGPSVQGASISPPKNTTPYGPQKPYGPAIPANLNRSTNNNSGGGGNDFNALWNQIHPGQGDRPAGWFGESLASNQMDDQSATINAGWDSYVNQLNDMLNVGLPGQQQAQQDIANTSYTSGVNQLGAQKAQGETDVAKQQATSLKDLSDNLRNLFQSGNIYLGARGANDSSATGQYSYALTKLGSKARGDITTQVNNRLSQIGDIYNTEVNRLESDKNTRIAQISDWFNQAQNQLRQSLGQAGLGRSQDLQAASQNLYNQALQGLSQIQAEQQSQRQALESWALSNSKTVQELIGNMQSLSQLPQFQGIQGGMPQVNSQGGYGTLPMGYGSTTEDKNKGLFG